MARRRIGAVLAGAIALVVALGIAPLPASAAPTAAVMPTATAGKATHYTATGGGATNGNCSFPALPADGLYVALGPAEYAAGAACGSYLDVTGPRGSVRVVVMDRCPECGPGHIDLSRTAFAKIAPLADGIVPVTFRAVKNPSVPTLGFRFKDGASQWWFAIQVLDHGNRLASVEVQRGGAWLATRRVDYGYWIYEPGAGPGPYSVRVTDGYGQQVVVSGITMSPMVVQRTASRLYGSTSETATVTQVIDGDSLVLSTGVRVRLIGIDAPESGRPGAAEATAYARSLLLGKRVTVTRVFGLADADANGESFRYISLDGYDYGRAALVRGWSVARYDSRDGYGRHPKEAWYVATDRAYPTP